MTLRGKTALVTGGSRGIGRAIVERLAADGARVVFTYRESAAAAGEVAAATGATAVRADQSSAAAVDVMFDAVGGRLDVLVNNVGIGPAKELGEITAYDINWILTVNFTVPLLVTQRAAAVMGDGGRIVNLSTLNTVVPGAGLTLYCASKAALEQLTAVAARELGPRGITVNTVSPGATDTDMWRGANSPESQAATPAMTALGRIGRPADVAAVVAFLAGPDGGWITGQNLRATGGLLV